MLSNIKEIKTDNYTWIDILNPAKSELNTIAEKYNLNYFLVVDSLEFGHLPKIEKQTNYEFFILRAYTANKNENVSTVGELSNKIAFFLFENKLITIHRADFDFLDIIDSKHNSVFSLLLDIIDDIIQSFVAPSQWHSQIIDDVEKILFLKNASKISLEELYFQKSETRISKKLLIFTQNVLQQISIPIENKSFFQDIKDKLVNLILVYDEVLEDANNLMNTYLSVAAQKSNDVMKLLTIFSAFFLPLTFIAGIYGMNFDFMPELKYKFGYFIVLFLMIIIAIAIFIWFKRRKII